MGQRNGFVPDDEEKRESLHNSAAEDINGNRKLIRQNRKEPLLNIYPSLLD